VLVFKIFLLKKIYNSQTADVRKLEIPANKSKRKREEFEKQDKISQNNQKLRQFTMDFFYNEKIK